jgi:AcrR family transcriptional regulator
MPRNRLLTEARLLDAARALVAESGFAKLGVNSAAARAGYDKVLIYRYFGGYDGLLERLAQSEDFFPHPAEVLPREMPEGGAIALLRDFAHRMGEAMSARELTRSLARWESAVDNALCQGYRDARKQLRQQLEQALNPDACSRLLLELVFRRMERAGFEAQGVMTGLNEVADRLHFEFVPPELPADTDAGLREPVPERPAAERPASARPPSERQTSPSSPREGTGERQGTPGQQSAELPENLL